MMLHKHIHAVGYCCDEVTSRQRVCLPRFDYVNKRRGRYEKLASSDP